jgi:hypothetical protein
MKMNALDWIAFVLLVVGGINWGLIGIFEFDLIEAIFGELLIMSEVIYALIGISALYQIYSVLKK